MSPFVIYAQQLFFLGGQNLTTIYRQDPSGVKPYIVFDLTSFAMTQSSAYNLYGYNTNYCLFNLRLYFGNWNTVMLKVNGNLTHPQGVATFYKKDNKIIIMDTGFSKIYSVIRVEKLYGINIPISVTNALPEGAVKMTDI